MLVVEGVLLVEQALLEQRVDQVEAQQVVQMPVLPILVGEAVVVGRNQQQQAALAALES
jgi:hypothetical protein